MNDKQLLTLLKLVMCTGICLIGLGVYLHMFSETMHKMGVKGIMTSACCVAVGMIKSFPTKMYLTFYLVTKENGHNHNNDVHSHQ